MTTNEKYIEELRDTIDALQEQNAQLSGQVVRLNSAVAGKCRMIDALEGAVKKWRGEYAEIHAKLVQQHEALTRLRTPCRCDPPRSEEERCNGTCQVRAQLAAYAEGLPSVSAGQWLWVFDEAVKQLAGEG
jgi:hypothetical protein